jgi:drug/metabolite transporter (DMT)-like permease
MSPRLRTILQALLVTFLWSTSWVLVKVGLEELPALPFAGLRYSLAFLILLPFVMRNKGQRAALGRLTRFDWLRLVALGLLFYTVTQGSNFWALFYLPAATFSLMLNFTTVIVAMLGILTLREIPSPIQWSGIALFLIGVAIYFYPVAIPQAQVAGYIIAGVSVLANAFSSILGRYVNRESRLDPTTVTVVSMGVGAIVLLVSGIAIQGLPRPTLLGWAIIGWLALVNSAFAFTLWNLTLRTLSAAESSIINNTMLIQIAILAWLFLGERLSTDEIAGLLLASAGILVAQVRWRPRLRRKAAL